MSKDKTEPPGVQGRVEGAAYTPGPWVADSLPRFDAKFRRTPSETPAVFADEAPAGDKLVAECWGSQARANAHLIAAAPDLLQACKVMLALLEEGGEHKTPMFRAPCNGLRAAIAKALAPSTASVHD